jgi:hypothetical protein
LITPCNPAEQGGAQTNELSNELRPPEKLTTFIRPEVRRQPTSFLYELPEPVSSPGNLKH